MLREIKDTAIRLGFEPWLRPIFDRVRGHEPSVEDIVLESIFAALPKNAVCIDVGSNKGKVLDPMRNAVTQGHFFAFEPIPYLYDLLVSKYRSDTRVELINMALSSRPGEAKFYVNETDFGLSGLNDRPNRMGQNKVREIAVKVETLDRVIGERRVDLIKIDVEGAEYDVLTGAYGTLARCRPIVLFEFGLGGADYFGVDAVKMFQFFETLGYALFALQEYTPSTKHALDFAEFKQCFDTNSNWDFVAIPSTLANATPHESRLIA
jgi:FkbM family methyltransferase